MPEFRKLSWQCRRGNLELDLVLTHYLEYEFSAADDTERNCFRELLKLEDNQLFALLMGDTIAAENFPSRFIDKLRNSRQAPAAGSQSTLWTENL